MIRHLHDLAALDYLIKDAGYDFVATAKESLDRDKNDRRGGDIIANMPIADRLTKDLKILEEDALYQNEYEQFVSSMSYATEKEMVSFQVAKESLGRIIAIYNQ